MKSILAAIFSLLLAVPCFAIEGGGGVGFAQPVNGGNGDTQGRVPTTRNVKTTASTGATVQNKLVTATYQAFPNSTTFNTALTTTTFVRGIAQSTVAAGAAFQMVTYGPSLCVFDGQTVVGDVVEISSTVAGDCHDAATTTPPAAGTQMVGLVLSLNTGTGTTANIMTLISDNTGANVCTFAKCSVGTSNVTCGKAVMTQACSATLGPLPNDPGPSNGTFFVTQSSAYALFGATPPTAADWQLKVTCAGSNSTDPHGFPPGAIVAGTQSINSLAAVTFGSKDINPNGCTAEIDCEEGSTDTTGAFQIVGTGTDGNSINTSSGWFIGWCQGDIP